ncbi:MAG: glycosyltransferase [Rhodoferax sp.]|nr:glycosyltransferase [Rhodoferax sp.]
MRVLHMYRTYFPETQGGLQEAIRQLCLATQSLGVENTIFALARQPYPTQMELPEGRLVRAKSWLEPASCDIGAWAALKRCRAAADACDIIQIHYPWPFADVLLPFIRRRGQKLVVTYHSDVVRQGFLDKLYAPLRRRMFGQATKIVATSPNYARTSELLRAYAPKVRSIPLCLGEQPRPDPARMAAWAARLGSGFFLFVGVLRYYKGLDVLTEAAGLVSHPIVILGDGPEMDSLQQSIEDRKLKNVHLLGALGDEDKNALFALCRGVVFPSHLRSEAFGIALLEGARAGKPLICCEIGTGTTWVNRHDETGLVVPPGDAVALAAAMDELAADDALCLQLGGGARNRWQQFFTPPVVGVAYRALYDDLMGCDPSLVQNSVVTT